MGRPPKGQRPMKAKVELRIDEDEKTMIRAALNSTSVVSTASVARDLLLRAAGDILLAQSGKLTPEQAGVRYAAYITALSTSSADISRRLVELPEPPEFIKDFNESDK